MAYRDNYYERPRRGTGGLFAASLFLFTLALALYFGLPLVKQIAVNVPAAAPKLALPTLSAEQRAGFRLAAPASDVEQRALKQGPAQATPAPELPNVRQPGNAQPADDVPGASFSPQDLGNRPVPTPTTMLTQEQYDAAQASEEQNYLNSVNSTMTDAQRGVAEHDAQWNAQTP